jgi:nucleoside-diphosphate-sugar epimerase
LKKKILIIGGTGFIGSNLISKIDKSKFKVFSLSRNKPKKNKKIKNISYMVCDLTNKKNLRKVLKNEKFDFVINSGGEIDHSNNNKVYKSHFLGAKNLADIFKDKKIKKFIQLGSSIENGNVQSPQKEHIVSDINRIKSSYGKAKHLATKLLLDYYRIYSFPVVIFRLYQVYGPHQSTDRLIPFIIKNSIEDKKFPCSSGVQSRDFIYIDDLIKLILMSFNNSSSVGQVFNVGLGKPINIKKIIKMITKKTKKGTPDFGKIKLRKDEKKIICSNNSKLKKVFKWKSKISFHQGIDKTIRHFRKNAI